MVTTIWGTTKKPVSSQQLADFFERNVQDNGNLYIGYPVIASPEGPYPIDAIWISPEKGVVIFNLIEGRTLGGYEEVQDESANRLETKLRAHKSLMRGRRLIAAPNVITYAPLVKTGDKTDPAFPVCNDTNLDDHIKGLVWDHPEAYEAVISVLQSISTIRRGRRSRVAERPNSRGSKLKSLEDSIANLDNIQGRAVIETVEGVQRIRGLAGSGKTIVLALKAAYLHVQHPDWKIAVTFNTRSLKDQFKRLINTFVIEQTNEEPIWENISVINAWGGPGGPDRVGVYYLFCEAHGLEYFDLRSAQDLFPREREFESVCERALSQIKSSATLFDMILVDEAQDFAPAFLRLCYESLDHRKRLVYAYDELQSLNDKFLLPPEELFGVSSDGTPKVQFRPPQPGQPKQDVILEKCYRNSRPILATAHALGFGIYRDQDPATKTGLIQMFDRNELWLDVGYNVVSGALEDGSRVQLARSPQTSPRFLEDHSEIDDLIQFHCFANKDDQAQWLADAIRTNLNGDELSYDDIIVINPDPRTTRKEVGRARRRLYEFEINSDLAGVDTSPDVFFDVGNKSVAFTGIFRAKGNEAGMVYVINADDCVSSFGNLARVRNRLFTAMTRSKAWVRVLGVGDGMRQLMIEFDRIREKNFELDFAYPTAEQRKHINIVNRDMTEEEKRSIQAQRKTVKSLVDDFETGRVKFEDLPPDDLQRLRALLLKGVENGGS